MTMRLRISLTLAIIGLTGCKVGPEYCLPQVPVPQEWNSSNDAEIITDACVVNWWEQLNDPFLNQAIPLLACRNHDIRIAYAKVQEALALRKMTSSKLFPQLDGHVQYNHAFPAGGVLSPTGTPGISATPGIPLNLEQTVFLAAFDALWELDLFGRTRREIDSAQASYLMENDRRNLTLISILGEFGRTYLQARRAQIQRTLLGREVEILERETALRTERVDRGLDRAANLSTLQASLEQLRSTQPQIEAEYFALSYHLSVLLGDLPNEILQDFDVSCSLPDTPDALSIGIPSELLRRRPDIRLAEHNIARATAEVGIATADLFPRITLTGRYGYEYLRLGMTRGEGETWGYGGDLLTPIFRAGQLRSNLQRNQWMRKESFLSYEQTVLRAFEETQTALLRYIKAKEAENSLKIAYQRSSDAAYYSKEQFNHGLINEILHLESQRALIESERAFADAKMESGIQFIALYKSLGGGWDSL